MLVTISSLRRRAGASAGLSAAAIALLLGVVAAAPTAQAQKPKPKAASAQAARPDWLRLGPLPKARANVKGFRGVETQGMGLIPSTEDDFAKNKTVRVAKAMRGTRPPQVLLTDYLPPVQKQGKQGSCVGWSTAYYANSYVFARQMRLTPEQRENPRYQFSPSFIYHLGNRGADQGMRISRGFEILNEMGCSSLAEMPYNETDATSPPDAAALARAKKHRPRDIVYLYSGLRGDTERLKTWLADMRVPLVMAIPIFSDFPMKKVEPDFVYEVTVDPARKNMSGFHAVTIVGYDESKKAFRLVNSWGPQWGDRGFLWVSEDFVRNYSFEAWGQIPGGMTSRGYKLPERIKIVPPTAKKTAATTTRAAAVSKRK